MTQLFTGRLRPFPGTPESWSGPKQLHAARVLEDAQRLFPEFDSELVADADVEDFWEDACRASAAWLASGGDIRLATPGTPASPWTEEMLARRFGAVTTAEEGGGFHGGPDRYLNHPLVQEHGGRALQLGSLEGDTDVIEWLAARHRDHGVTHGIVKAAQFKGGIWSVKLDEDPQVIQDRLFDAMDWTYVRLAELENSVLAQDRILLEWEYRLFVVDGKVVSGAGCVEEFTPLDHLGEGFDTRVRRHRGHMGGSPSQVEARPEVVAELIRFGEDIASLHGGTVVIDVAVGTDHLGHSRPVIIEFNPLPNAGLYASNPWSVARALRTAADRGYHL